MNNSLLLVILSWFFSIHGFGQHLTRIDNSTIELDSLEKRYKDLQVNANVHGMTISIFNADSLIFNKAYGYRDIKKDLTLETSHNFYAASLSKPLFAFIVMKLVDEGKIDLDKPLVDYLHQPLPEYQFDQSYEGYQDLATDDRYQLITARMCLSHTSGFPNWRYIGKTGINFNKPLEIQTDPGSKYSYSGEGIQLLQFVVEQITEKNLEELAQTYVFKPFDMPMTSFVWQDRFDENFVVGHYKKKKTLERRKRTVEYAAGSMDTTPEDYTRFLQAILAKKLLKSSSYNEMFTPQVRIRSRQQFGSNSLKTTNDNDDIELSYGLGWGLYKTPYGQAVFKEGHLQGWEHYTLLYPSSNLGILIMTNSSNGEGIFKELVEFTLGDRWMPWYWENFIPYDR